MEQVRGINSVNLYERRFKIGGNVRNVLPTEVRCTYQHSYCSPNRIVNGQKGVTSIKHFITRTVMGKRSTIYLTSFLYVYQIHASAGIGNEKPLTNWQHPEPDLILLLNSLVSANILLCVRTRKIVENSPAHELNGRNAFYHINFHTCKYRCV